MRPAKLLLSALPLFISAVALAQPAEKTVTRSVTSTLPSGNTVQRQQTISHAPGHTSLKSTVTGPAGRSVSRSASSSRDNDISRQIRAITGPGGASAAGQTSQKVAQAGITRTSLGAIPNTRALAAQIAACQPSGNASGLSLPPAASQAAAAQAERIRLPEGVYHERPQALNQALAGDDNAPAQSITRDRKPEFLPGQGAQPGSKLTAARAAHAAGTGDPTANAVKSSRARAAASAKAARK
jgi:hypothetical protein